MPYSPVTQPSAAKMAVRLTKQLDHDPGDDYGGCQV